MLQVKIGGKLVQLPQKPLDEGGEARVFRLDHGRVVKVYRLPTDPGFEHDQAQLAAARIRVIVAQRKLPLFPRDLPSSIVAPQELVYETTSNLVIGYTMPFIEGAQPISAFKSTSSRNDGVTDRQVMGIFRGLMGTVQAVHDRGTIIGDFNDTNVLVRGSQAWLIDADSMQYGPFRAKVFMPEFVDPKLCDPNGSTLELVQLHNEASDWYAWWTMLFQSLLFIHPYGGVYKPTDKHRRVASNLRGLPQHRISVYHAEVKYPSSLQARPLDEMPQPLTDLFQLLFVDGLRPTPTAALFDRLRFRPDGSFDATVKQVPAPVAVTSAKSVHHKVIHSAKGRLLDVAVRDDLQILEYTDNALYRNGTLVLPLRWSDALTFCASGSRQTALALLESAIVHHPDWAQPLKMRLKIGVDKQRPMVAGTAHGTVFWDGAFKLVIGRKDPVIRILDIDPDLQPLGFWAEGDRLCILSSRKGVLGFAVHHLVWDVTICQAAHPFATPEQVTAAQGYANERNTWLFLSLGSKRSLCSVFDGTGRLLNNFDSAGQGITDWMTSASDKCQTGEFLFSPSEDGIIRLSMTDTALNVTRFPSSYQLRSTQLLVADTGLLAVDRAAQQILQLTVR